MKRGILLIGILCLGFLLKAQEKDSVQVEVFEEPVKPLKLTKDRFKYFEWFMLEEKYMFKITATPTPSYFVQGITLITGYEHKITPSFSLGAEIQTLIPVFRIHTSEKDTINLRTIHPKAFVRYYYSQKRRLKNQTSANNLLQNYIDLRLNDFYKGSFIVCMEWGAQRRIGKYGYFDGGVGVGLSTFRDVHTIYFGGHLAIGLGFSNKNIHRRKK